MSLLFSVPSSNSSTVLLLETMAGVRLRARPVASMMRTGM